MKTVYELLESIKAKKEFKDVFIDNQTEVSMRYGDFSPSCGHLGSEFCDFGTTFTFRRHGIADPGEEQRYELLCRAFRTGSINVIVNTDSAYVYNHAGVDRLVIPLRDPFKNFRLHITINA